MTINGGTVQSDMEFEVVKIGGKKGKYAVNDSRVMMLNWTENDIHYRLAYYGQQSEKEITKKDLIETAMSFE